MTVSHIEQIVARVAGIPCLIGVTRYESAKGSFSSNAPSDLDYYGWSESEWEVLDSRGRPAPWLERKMTDRERDRIDQLVYDHFSEMHK